MDRSSTDKGIVFAPQDELHHSLSVEELAKYCNQPVLPFWFRLPGAYEWLASHIFAKTTDSASQASFEAVKNLAFFVDNASHASANDAWEAILNAYQQLSRPNDDGRWTLVKMARTFLVQCKSADSAYVCKSLESRLMDYIKSSKSGLIPAGAYEMASNLIGLKIDVSRTDRAIIYDYDEVLGLLDMMAKGLPLNTEKWGSITYWSRLDSGTYLCKAYVTSITANLPGSVSLDVLVGRVRKFADRLVPVAIAECYERTRRAISSDQFGPHRRDKALEEILDVLIQAYSDSLHIKHKPPPQLAIIRRVLTFGRLSPPISQKDLSLADSITWRIVLNALGHAYRSDDPTGADVVIEDLIDWKSRTTEVLSHTDMENLMIIANLIQANGFRDQASRFLSVCHPRWSAVCSDLAGESTSIDGKPKEQVIRSTLADLICDGPMDSEIALAYLMQFGEALDKSEFDMWEKVIEALRRGFDANPKTSSAVAFHLWKSQEGLARYKGTDYDEIVTVRQHLYDIAHVDFKNVGLVGEMNQIRWELEQLLEEAMK